MAPEKPKVLVVDDHPANRLAFEVVLSKHYDVQLAESGLEAVERVRGQEFAVIVLDVRMPGLDGFETAGRLRQLKNANFTTILFTSAVEQTLPHILRGLRVGATDYLLSPVDPELLRSKVDNYCRIYLMTLALRKQVAELHTVIGTLRREIERELTPNDALRARVEQLEAVNAELRRQVADASFAEGTA